MPPARQAEARIAVACFSALGASVLSASIVNAFAPAYAQAAAGVGLAVPFVAVGLGAARRRWTRRASIAARPARSHA